MSKNKVDYNKLIQEFKNGDVVESIVDSSTDEDNSASTDIQQVDDAEIQNSALNDSQKATNTEVQKNGNTEINEAVNTEIRPQSRIVNLTIKLPEELRNHWLAEARRRGLTLSSIIRDHLEDRFGKPE